MAQALVEAENRGGIKILQSSVAALSKAVEFLTNTVIDLSPVIEQLILAAPAKQGLLNPLQSQEYAVVPFPTEVSSKKYSPS